MSWNIFQEDVKIIVSILTENILSLQCQDSAGDLYSYVEFNGNPLSSNDCAQTCGQLPSQDLVGFYFGTLGPTCRCYYSAKNVPAPPLGLDWAIIGTTDKGSGPIKNASTLFGECYAFAQVREM